MSQVMRRIEVRHAVFGLAFAGWAISSIASANAGDIDRPVYSADPYSYRTQPEYNGPCRIFHERRIDGYGRETIHRIRMCDEGPVYSPNWTAAPPPDYGPRRYYEPSSSDYYTYPRPPAPIGPAYYN
jgi:hypothetical protein